MNTIDRVNAMHGIHDSSTCTLGADGGPCADCLEVAQWEREAAEERQRPPSPPPQIEWTIQQLTRIREVILSVIDGGKPLTQHTSMSALPWDFYSAHDWEQTTSRNEAHRLEFCDAIQRELIKGETK